MDPAFTATLAELLNGLLPFLVSPAILLKLAFSDQVERRCGYIEISRLYQFGHVTEKESHDESGNVASVHIGICHDDDLVVADPFQVQRLAVFLCSNAHSQGNKYVLYLLVLENLMLHGLLNIQDLTTEGHNGLKMPVTALLGRTSC